MKKMSPKTKSILWAVGCGFGFTLSMVLIVLSIWTRKNFNVSFKEIIYTITTPLQGTGTGIVGDALAFCLPIIGIFVVLYIAAAIVFLLRKEQIFRKLRRAGVIFCAVFLVFGLIFSSILFRIPEYLSLILTDTHIYETYYVDPKTVTITASDEPKNLICIYLESMETTFASSDVGGTRDVNYIPNLTALAKENLSFSNKSDGLIGGFRSPIGTTWTMAALLASTSGIPYSFPISGNTQDMYSEQFAPGLTTLGDVLAEKGYRQMFLCGSDAGFAGRKTYFEQHGNYEIYDLFSARENGDLPTDDYFNDFWGYEDQYLYEIAKRQLTELAAGDQPFNLTMLTVDTHFPEGDACSLCEAQYGTTLENALACADRQVADFVDWCRQQPFYEDTVIVITGDHPFMGTDFCGELDEDERIVYNCFINTDTSYRGSHQNRDFTAMDLFPTVLAAMGFEIEGDRLGLGVNLFSERPTLCELLGYDYVATEINRSSDYYIEKFG